MLKKMWLDLMLSFITGLLMLSMLMGRVTWQIVLVCLACVAIMACGYGIGYFLKKLRKRHI